MNNTGLMLALCILLLTAGAMFLINVGSSEEDWNPAADFMIGSLENTQQ